MDIERLAYNLNLELDLIQVKLFNTSNKEMCEHMRPRAADFRCRILDNGLFISNLSGSCGLDMSHVTSNDFDVT